MHKCGGKKMYGMKKQTKSVKPKTKKKKQSKKTLMQKK